MKPFAISNKVKKITGLVATATVFAATIAASSVASAETSIKFSNDWKWEGPAAPLLHALDSGYFKDAGLDV